MPNHRVERTAVKPLGESERHRSAVAHPERYAPSLPRGSHLPTAPRPRRPLQFDAVNSSSCPFSKLFFRQKDDPRRGCQRAREKLVPLPWQPLHAYQFTRRKDRRLRIIQR